MAAGRQHRGLAPRGKSRPAWTAAQRAPISDQVSGWQRGQGGLRCRGGLGAALALLAMACFVLAAAAVPAMATATRAPRFDAPICGAAPAKGSSPERTGQGAAGCILCPLCVAAATPAAPVGATVVPPPSSASVPRPSAPPRAAALPGPRAPHPRARGPPLLA